MGGFPVLVDVDAARAAAQAQRIADKYSVRALGLSCDITQPREVETLRVRILETFDRLDILINNAANNPKMEATAQGGPTWSRLEHFPLEMWHADLAVG